MAETHMCTACSEGTLRAKPKSKRKVEKVMGEFGKGTLKSSSGQQVTNPKQAIAIGLSEARRGKK